MQKIYVRSKCFSSRPTANIHRGVGHERVLDNEILTITAHDEFECLYLLFDLAAIGGFKFVSITLVSNFD